MYIEVVDSATLPYGWSIDAEFSLAVVSQTHDHRVQRGKPYNSTVYEEQKIC